MSNTWNLNGYQYDDTGYNYDSFEVAPFESEQGAYMSVCALANYSDGMTSGMGNVNAGSVQNVDLSSMNSHKACLGGLGSTLGSTMGRMGASLNARFKAEVEAGTLFGGQQIPADFDFAGYLKDLSYEKSGEILGTISNFGSTSENFGEDVYDPKTMLSTDLESLKTSDPSSYQTQMASLYELAKGKDCSEWTMDEKYAVISHYEDLEAKYADAKARSDEAAMWGGYDDAAYTEMGRYKKEMKAIEADLKELGIMEYTATEKGWQNIKSATKALWNEGKDVFSALGQGDFKGAWQEAKEFGRQASATNTVIAESAASGVAKIFEWGADFTNIIGTAAVTPATYVVDALAGTDITKNMWNSTMDDVAKDKVGLAREWFYENTNLGQSINEDSLIKWDSDASKLVQNVGTKAGEIAIATAVTVATGGTAAPFVAAGIGFLEGGGQEAERRFNLTDENGNYTNRGAKDILMATLHGVGKGAEWYGYGQLGQVAFQGIKTASALGKEGIAQIGKSITGAEAKAYLKANVGNLAKQAGVNMVKDVDTWVDIGTGVTNFIINGETTGQYNWGELALDTGLAIVGNYVGAFGGEYLEGAIENAGKVGRNVDNLLPSTSALDADTPKFTVLDGNGHPVTTDIILASGIDTNNMVPDGKYLFDEDGSIVRVDGLFDQNSPDVDLDDVKIAHQMASDQSVYDVEYSINKYMEKYGVTRAEAFDQIQSIIDEHDFKYMTSNGGARQLLRQYSFDDLQNALNVAKRMDNVDDAAVVNIEYAMNQYMRKYGVSRTQAIHVMDRLIEDQDLYRMTSAGGARNLLGQYSFGELDDALMKIKLADAAAASSFTPSAGAFTGGRPSTFTNKADEFFGNVKSNMGSKYGIDQGLIFDFTYYQDANGKILSYKQAEELYNAAIEKGDPVPRFKRIGNEEYFKVKDLLRDKYGIDYNSSSALLNALDRTGACTYAGTCNEIFYAFRNHPQLFEDSFGFPMYTTVNGSVIPNYSALLADVYVNANAVENGGKFLFKGADGSYHVRPEILTAKTDGLGRRLIDSDLQTYLTLTKTGKNTDVINRYLNQRGLSFHSRVIVDYGSVPSTSQMDDIIRHISDGQDKGLTYTIDIYDNGIKGINLKSLDPNVPSDTTLRYKGGGHEVFITGMTQEGFLVSSYGNKYVIPFSDLLDSRSQWMLNESAITRLNNKAAKELSSAFGGNNRSIRSAADGIDDLFRSGDNIDIPNGGRTASEIVEATAKSGDNVDDAFRHPSAADAPKANEQSITSTNRTQGPKQNRRDEFLSRAQDDKARKLVNNVYRDGATVGDGGTADKFRQEMIDNNGDWLSCTHFDKGLDRVNEIANYLKLNPDSPDKGLLLEIADDLMDALPDYFPDKASYPKPLKQKVNNYIGKCKFLKGLMS